VGFIADVRSGTEPLPEQHRKQSNSRYLDCFAFQVRGHQWGVTLLPDLLTAAQTSGPLPVEIVNLKDDGNASWAVPALTGGATFLGVLVAGWIQNKIEDKRQSRALDAEKRRAIGALRLARRYFAGVIHHTGAAAIEMDCSLLRGMESPLRPEEETLLATWITDDEWRLYTIPVGKMRVLHQLLECYEPGSSESSTPSTTDLRHMRELWDSARAAVIAFQGAQDRLAAAVGDRVVKKWDDLTGAFPELDDNAAGPSPVPEEPDEPEEPVS
jgi:hypothetical protein